MNPAVPHITRREFLLAGCGGVAALAFGSTAQPSPALGGPLPPAVSLDVKIGQMILTGFRGFVLTRDNPIVADLRKRYLGGTVLFDYDVPTGKRERNIQSPQQLEALDADLLHTAAVKPLLISVDQEGGIINRLHPRYGFPPSYSQEYLGKVSDLAFTYECALKTAQTLKDMHINLNLAPVVDLKLQPNNVIGRYERSFARYPDVVAAHAKEVIRAHHDLGVLTTLKHFPGHGSAKADTHAGFVDVTREWSSIELEPFRQLINNEERRLAPDVIMTAHLFNANLDKEYPATLSYPTMTGLLRGELHWNGVIITDDMGMGAIADNYGLEQAVGLAIKAGVDILAFAINGPGSVFDPQIPSRAFAEIKRLVASGEISEARIDESYRRIMDLKTRL